MWTFSFLSLGLTGVQKIATIQPSAAPALPPRRRSKLDRPIGKADQERIPGERLGDM